MLRKVFQTTVKLGPIILERVRVEKARANPPYQDPARGAAIRENRRATV